MGHLSPFHYASESILLIYTLAFIAYRVWRIDNFQILTCRQLKETPGRVIAMYLIIVAALSMLTLGIVSCVFKYSEGWVQASDGSIVLKPKKDYSPLNHRLSTATDFLAEASMISKGSAFFLTLATLNRISDSYLQTPFMSSTEFRVYTAYSLISIPLYFLIQFLYWNDAVMTNVAPQILYDAEQVILFILFVVMGVRLTNLCDKTQLSRELQKRMRAIVRNVYLAAVCCLIDAIGHGTIGIDTALVQPIGVSNLPLVLMDFLSFMHATGFTLAMVAVSMILIPEPLEHGKDSGTAGIGTGGGGGVGVKLGSGAGVARRPALELQEANTRPGQEPHHYEAVAITLDSPAPAGASSNTVDA